MIEDLTPTIRRPRAVPAAEPAEPLEALAEGLFAPEALAALLGEVDPPAATANLAATAAIAQQWLMAGGKRLRPLVTLWAVRAVGGPATPGPAERRLAVAIEAFHKASLVHDDIEDDDATRYGLATLHRQHGLPTAINVGDYLLGLGYRLVATLGPLIDPQRVAALLDYTSQAHLRLAQGQGAELAWRDPASMPPTPREVLRVYALKTAPAFEAALVGGVLLGAGLATVERLAPALARFARTVGVGFQVRNDLAGLAADAQAGRVTLLTALAEASATGHDRTALSIALGRRGPNGQPAEPLADLLARTGAVAHAEAILARLRARADRLAASLEPPALADLGRQLARRILRPA